VLWNLESLVNNVNIIWENIAHCVRHLCLQYSLNELETLWNLWQS